MMQPDLQPTLSNEFVKIEPLKEEHFEILFIVASDPLIWEQHPNKDRYKEEIFRNFFKGAIESGGAFLITDAKTNQPVGSSRYYGYEKDNDLVSIGYTFISRDHWGTTCNSALKALMLDHAFGFVNSVLFHIGAVNIRSQKAILKLGAVKTGESEMEYYGESKNLNYIYTMTKDQWEKLKKDR